MSIAKGFGALAALACLALFSGGASAYTVSLNDTTNFPTSVTPVLGGGLGQFVISPLGGPPNSGLQTGSIGGAYRSPWESSPGVCDATNSCSTNTYLSVSANGLATVDFGAQQQSLELLWGSIDNYNFIKLYNGSLLIATLVPTSGGSVAGSTDLALGAPTGTGHHWVVIAATNSSEYFTKAVFGSQGANAFEFSSVSTVPVPGGGNPPEVPVPGALVLLGTALFGSGLFSRWRHQRKRADWNLVLA